MNLSKFIPRSLRRWIYKIQHRIKYDIKFGRNAYAKNCHFEGRNTLREGASLINGKMGYGSYISENSALKNIEIGRYTCIGPNVTNFYGKHPTSTFVSIHPAFYSLSAQAGFTFAKKQLFEEHSFIDSEKKISNIIGNDVWIGCNVIIMDGITIGNGAIIAAGSVITKNVQPYSIVGGIPAKPIKSRFNYDQIKLLEKIKWWEKDIETLKQFSELFIDVDILIKKMSP